MAETHDGTGGLVAPTGMPDLSHLTHEERAIIEGVMARQKQEEEKEMEILRKKQDEVRLLETAIRLRNEEQRRKGVELEATCQICMKTKFADGIGHICNYCNVRCCARCGGKVTLRSNKVIWVCILCRKKQELLIKTGQWLHSNMAAKQRAMEAGEESPIAHEELDKRPKLERAHSEGKENVAQGPFSRGMSRKGSLQQIHRTNSQRELRRQFSQERDSAKQGNRSEVDRYPDRNRPPCDRSPPEVKRVRAVDVSGRDNFSRLRGSELDSRGRYDGCSDPSYDRQDRYSEQGGLRRGKDPNMDKDMLWKDGHQKSREGYHGNERRYSIRDQTWISHEDDSRTTHSDSAAFTRRISQESLRDPSDRSHRDSRLGYAGSEDWKDSSRKRDYEVHSDDTRLRLHPMRTSDDRKKPSRTGLCV